MPEKSVDVSRHHLGGDFDDELRFLAGQVQILQVICGAILRQTTDKGDAFVSIISDELRSAREYLAGFPPGVDKSFQNGALSCLDKLLSIITED